MASQPANTEISVFRTVRTQRNPLRHDTIKNITHKLRELVIIAPGEEDLTEVKSRNTAVSDFSSFMGEGRPSATRGLPVVIGVKEVKNFSLAENLTNIDFPAQIGHDKFIYSDADNAGQDLHQDARDLD